MDVAEDTRPAMDMVGVVPPEIAAKFRLHADLPSYLPQHCTRSYSLPEVIDTEKSIHLASYNYPAVGSHTPAVLDLGGYHCRAGWAGQSDPLVDVRSIVRRSRKKKNNGTSKRMIGNGGLSVTALQRFGDREIFENGLTTDENGCEMIMDYLLSRLITSPLDEGMSHPILFTEPVANFNLTRDVVSELSFECYGAPQVCFGVDALFAHHHVSNSGSGLDSSHSLILSSGYSHTSVLPYINNKLVLESAKRIEIGGRDGTNLLDKILRLKYPMHRGALAPQRVRYLKESFSYVPPDYGEELALLFSVSDRDAESNPRAHIIQFPVPEEAVQAQQKDRSDAEERSKARVAQMQKLQEMAAERREEQRKASLVEWEALKKLHELAKTDQPAYQAQLKERGFRTKTQLENAMFKAEAKGQVFDDDVTAKEEDIVEEYPLVRTEPSELSADQKFEQRRQKHLFSHRMGKLKSKQRKHQKKLDELEEKRLEEEQRNADPEGWLRKIYEERQALVAEMEKRKREAQEGKSSQSRRSRQQAERLKLMNQHAMEDEEGDKTFGENDDDWDVYDDMAVETSNDDDEDEIRLKELDDLLYEHDRENVEKRERKVREEMYQIQLCVERIRVPEIIFQPSIVGVDQMGVMECVQHVLGSFPPDVQVKLAQNVLLTGGNFLFPGMTERVERELQAIRPCGSPVRVFGSSSRSDGWRGASRWCGALGSEVGRYFFSKKEWHECGSGYLKEHAHSNPFYPTINS
eukprot:TRINITY_DN1797_c0_g1_i1.p2 TRINITY_DN1797_c0_g1~~TRINITY_DN1797_c0_g1_i1.p2  ORF type:complete len:748 (-),score=157.91 TRINITY_DN1797_c0_g1_i1:3968-6211(-)